MGAHLSIAVSPYPGIHTIASGSLPAGANYLDITNIPETYAYLILKVTGAVCATATRALLVRASVDNGSSFDATAANYVGHKITGTTWTNYTSNAFASLIDSVTQTTLQLTSFTLNIHGYQGGPNARADARVISATVEYQNWCTYIGSTSNIDALRIIWNGTGNFSSGTYVLYGVA